MTSTFSGIGIALSGLMAQRQAIETTGHNVANANTEGFTRQEVVLSARTPLPAPYSRYRLPVGQVGTGVDLTGIRRIRDVFVDLQLRWQSHSLGRWATQAETLERLQEVFQEPSDDGLGTLISAFWNAWDELGNAPQSPGARANVLGAANALCTRLNQAYKQMEDVQADLNHRIAVQAQEVNNIAREISILNEQIQNVQTSGDQPNDLRDRRDLLLDKLARIVSFRSVENENGSIAVYVNGSALVDGKNVYQIEVERDAYDNVTLRWAKNGAVLQPADGELKGLFEARDVVVEGLKAKLDNLAYSMATAVNEQHSQGDDLNGNAGLVFFTGLGADATGAAKYIQVNSAIAADSSLIAASARVTPPDAETPGDGNNARAIAALRDVALAPGANTINGYYEGMVVQLGGDARQALSASQNQEVVVNHLTRQREATSGVSLDEEATNLVRYQHAYAAAAQFMSVVDDMLDRLINVVGAAGT